MRIGTFNLENLGGKGQTAKLSKRIEVLRPQLLRLNADILCLQEVNAQRSSKHYAREPKALRELLAGTQYQNYFEVISTLPNSRGLSDRHNLVILSRWPFISTKCVWHDHFLPLVHAFTTASPPRVGATVVKWDRPILVGCADTPYGPVHIANLHLRAPLAAFVPGQKKSSFVWKSVPGWAEGFFLSSLKRNGQALEARIVTDEIFNGDPDAKIVVTGDFNASAQEPAFKILAGDIEDTGNGDLITRMLIPLEKTVPPHQRFTVIHAGRKVMLDHILISRSLLPHYHKMEIHNEALSDEMAGFAAIDASPVTYHAGVVAGFTFYNRSSQKFNYSYRQYHDHIRISVLRLTGAIRLIRTGTVCR